MNIAFLGWGSLIWDPRELPHYGPWQVGGPMLPIEYSRVSGDGRLTLVIDPTGPHVPTRFAISPRTNIADAVEDLRKREGTIRKHIGFMAAATGRSSRQEFPAQIDVDDIMKNWCLSRNFEACVWTALRSNFREELAIDFSPDEALAYLERLGKSTRENALRYIRNALPEVNTPVRQKVFEKWQSSES